MSHVFQVGAGSGGIVVLDLLAREAAVTRVTLVEPDVYAPHNVVRHVFPPAAAGRPKAELAAEWVRERRADLAVETLAADLTDPARFGEFVGRAAAADVGVCAVDNESAKYAFDAVMREARKPWTLGEVLSGGIGGWVHRFAPGGPCYGCVASYLKREVTEAPPSGPPDYSDPAARTAETTVPASRASISAVASLHAVVTLEVLAAGSESGAPRDEFTSLLLTLRRVPGVFEEAYRTYRFRVARAPACLVCSRAAPASGGDLDVAVDQALGRLAPP
jgi:molybdopterin/thiamine biosynthesis adenylyltransferase